MKTNQRWLPLQIWLDRGRLVWLQLQELLDFVPERTPDSSGHHDRLSRWQLRVYGLPSSDGVEGQFVERLSTAEELPDGIVVVATNPQRPVPAPSLDPEVPDRPS